MRPTLIEHPDGIYRPLELDIEQLMDSPVEVPSRPSWLVFAAKRIGYFVLMIVLGAGVLLSGLYVIILTVALRGAIKVWRAWW